MKAIHTTLATLLLGCTTLPLAFQEPEPPEATPVILGTYDSRVLAMAYYQSKGFEAELKAMQENATGEDMQALQARMHSQGFGTASIPGILERIEDDYEAIAKEMGVDVIVNLWEVDYRKAKVTTVDVSFRLAQAFSPSEDTLRVMQEISEQEPVPMEVLQTHAH